MGLLTPPSDRINGVSFLNIFAAFRSSVSSPRILKISIVQYNSCYEKQPKIVGQHVVKMEKPHARKCEKQRKIDVPSDLFVSDRSRWPKVDI